MDALTCITTRRTAPMLVGPEPSDEQLRQLLRAATLAPDHKFLRPWRFVIVRGEARRQLGESLAASHAATHPDAPPEALQRFVTKTTKSPCLLLIIASPKPQSPLPVWEQHASAAAAAQNICLAAHALGLGAAWKSVSLDPGPDTRRLLAMPEHEGLFGWIELGHLPEEFKLRERPVVNLADVTSELCDGQLKRFLGP